MSPSEIAELERYRQGDRRRRRAEFWKRTVAVIGTALILGVITYGLWLFFAFEGKSNSLATFTEAHPRHREIEFAIFLVTAFLPVAFYLVWLSLTRRRK